MKIEDYFKYYIQGSDHYLIPKDVFKELFNEMVKWKEEELKEKEDFLKNTNIESLRIEKQEIDELRRKVEQNDDINRKQLSDDFELIKQQIIDKLSEELIRWTEEYDIDNERSQGYMIGINKAKKIIKENMIFKLKTKSARLMRLLKESDE